MRGSAWRLAVALIGSAGIVLTSRSSGQVPLRQADPSQGGQPSVNVNPPPEPARRLTPTETLRQQLKETQDRLQAYEADNLALRRRNDLSENTVRTLDESLAVANAEREVFRRQYGELKLRMEALGMASVGDNKEALEERLLNAVRDLALVRDEKEKIAERLVALSETVMLYMKSATVADAKVRLEMEAQLRASNEAVQADRLGKTDKNQPEEPPATLTDAKVVSTKEEFSLIIANVGSRDGVKIGMPFQVVRDNKFVARARVVDVRERISGAIVEEYSSNQEKVKVGDGLRVELQG